MTEEFTRGKSVIEIDWSVRGELTQEYRTKIADIVMETCDHAMVKMLDIKKDLPIDPGVFATTFTTDKDHLKAQLRMHGLRHWPRRKYRNWRFGRRWAKDIKNV